MKHLFRTWWILAFGSSLLACAFLINQLYIKWDQSPVIVSFSEKSTPIYRIPFPSVTICPETKANKSMIDFTKVYHILFGGRQPPYNISDQELNNLHNNLKVLDFNFYFLSD